VKKSYFDETRQAGKSLYTVSTISYCDLHKITIDDLQTIMDAYPEFAGDFLMNFGVTFNLREVLSTFTISRFQLRKISSFCLSLYKLSAC